MDRAWESREKKVDTRLQHCTRYKHRDHEIKNSQKWFKTFYRMHLDVVRSFRSLNSHFDSSPGEAKASRTANQAHSRIPQTPILPNPHPLPTPPLAARNRRPSNNKPTHRLALAHFLVAAAHDANLNTADRSAKAAVTLASFAAVVKDVCLRYGAEDAAGCQGVDDACAREDAVVSRRLGGRR
jgi:hypothetical protein